MPLTAMQLPLNPFDQAYWFGLYGREVAGNDHGFWPLTHWIWKQVDQRRASNYARKHVIDRFLYCFGYSIMVCAPRLVTR